MSETGTASAGISVARQCRMTGIDLGTISVPHY